MVSIFLPPLRDRRDDIPALVAHFVDRFNKENRCKLKIAGDAMEVLSHCYWPGNVRELENCIERTATMANGDLIRGVSFPCRHRPLPLRRAGMTTTGSTMMPMATRVCCASARPNTSAARHASSATSRPMVNASA